MAIGSDPEIGVVFWRWGDMTDEQKALWFEEIRSWGSDLLGGYATLCYPDPERMAFYSEINWTMI
jgi:hypothetical protein